MRIRASSQNGFTLIELMIVVAIIGLLAAIAIPSFVKYMIKAKTAEAASQLEKMTAGARAYYLEDRYAGPGQVSPLPPQFPVTVAETPAITCCDSPGNRCVPDQADWDDQSWQGLQFAMDDPHYFRYAFDSSGTSTASQFTARAHADLDCDGVFSTYIKTGEVLFQGSDITTSGTLYRIREIE